MSVRLSELAKDLGTTKKELLEKLPALGYELKKSVVDIEEGLAQQIKEALRRSGTRFETPPKRVAPARPKPERDAAKPGGAKPAADSRAAAPAARGESRPEPRPVSA